MLRLEHLQLRLRGGQPRQCGVLHEGPQLRQLRRQLLLLLRRRRLRRGPSRLGGVEPTPQRARLAAQELVRRRVRAPQVFQRRLQPDGGLAQRGHLWHSLFIRAFYY